MIHSLKGFSMQGCHPPPAKDRLVLHQGPAGGGAAAVLLLLLAPAAALYVFLGILKDLLECVPEDVLGCALECMLDDLGFLGPDGPCPGTGWSLDPPVEDFWPLEDFCPPDLPEDLPDAPDLPPRFLPWPWPLPFRPAICHTADVSLDRPPRRPLPEVPSPWSPLGPSGLLEAVAWPASPGLGVDDWASCALGVPLRVVAGSGGSVWITTLFRSWRIGVLGPLMFGSCPGSLRSTFRGRGPLGFISRFLIGARGWWAPLGVPGRLRAARHPAVARWTKDHCKTEMHYLAQLVMASPYDARIRPLEGWTRPRGHGLY